jgi:hypothetical protein
VLRQHLFALILVDLHSASFGTARCRAGLLCT